MGLFAGLAAFLVALYVRDLALSGGHEPTSREEKPVKEAAAVDEADEFDFDGDAASAGAAAAADEAEDPLEEMHVAAESFRAPSMHVMEVQYCSS